VIDVKTGLPEGLFEECVSIVYNRARIAQGGI